MSSLREHKTILTVLLALLVSGAASADYDEMAEVERAEQAVAAFGKTLKTELMAAMQSGGPVAAIGVCNVRAPEIAGSLSVEAAMVVSRTSLKYRNPDNAATDWQTAVLESFEARKQAGESLSTLTWSEVTTSGKWKEFRFMKAIPTGALCLQCHGKTIAPPVAEKLAELYPEDKATGFSEGDLRGAFVVTRRLP